MSSNTVYVTGLPSSATQDDVMDFFTRIGNVAEVQMPAVNSGAPVTVVFDKAEDAATAVSISGSDFQEGISIHISAHPTLAPAAAAVSAAATPAATAVEKPQRAEEDSADGDDGAPASGSRVHRPRDDPRDVANKVAVSGLAPFTERRAVRDLFAACGEMDDFAMMPQRHLAFVGYTTSEAFEKALLLDGTVVNGSKISVERRRPFALDRGGGAVVRPGSAPPTIPNRVIVRNVPRTVSKESLRAFFAPDCGTPTDVFVKPDSGIAFLAFADAASTDKAMAKSGQEFEGNAIRVERREVLVCRRCGREGHKKAECRQPYCPDCRTVGHTLADCPRRRSGRGGERRRRRSSSSSSSDRHRNRRHRSDSSDRDRRRRRHSRSRSPERRRRHSRSRSPPRGRR